MKRFLLRASILGLGALIPGTSSSLAQSLDDLNIQIHGYATQGFLYTTQNNIFTTHSSDGSPAWTEAVVNVGAQPIPKLRIGVQARYFLLGNFGNSITLDWAAADYKQNDKIGARFGKVKTPSGLFNEIQDIDPSYIWTLLPQGIYPISSRNSILAHYGGVIYGTLDLKKAGKLEYRGWGGEREIGSADGYWISFTEEGISLPSGLNGPVSGAALHWRAPISGFMIGASLTHSNAASTPFNDVYVVPAGPSKGVTITTSGHAVFPASNSPDLFGKYEKDRVMFATEYQRTAGYLIFVGLSPVPDKYDLRSWYAMGSYKVSSKFTAGIYQSQYFDLPVALGPARYQKDWALSGRYDFNQYVYAKAEQHFVDGTSIGFDTALNPHGLKPDSRLTALKIGVSF